MVDRGDIERLWSANDELLRLAKNDLSVVLAVMDLGDPYSVRDALLDLVPSIVSQYGELAAVAAADWYDDLHPGLFVATVSDVADAAAVQGSVRALVGPLFTGDPVTVGSALQGAMQRHILYSSRDTIARNAEHDPWYPRFARVPRGVTTCAWCEMLASRGFVYHTEETAGKMKGHFHDACDCAIVPEWDQNQAQIEGYDPDAMYDRYLTARGELEAAGMKSIGDADVATKMREMFPDNYTDGHVH